MDKINMAEERIDIVGKELLEQLMFSLYPEAETIYREYLQNACDSINEAVKTEVLSNKKDGHVTINIDKSHHVITIEDNGTGIETSKVEMTLKSIACSKKKRESSAGLYGIGRLVGGGYCKQLIFRTSSINEDVASEMIFDMEQIRAILEDDSDNSSASEVIHRVTKFSTYPEETNKHYFKVILKDILPDYREILLDVQKINTYLSQVAPIPYEATFYNNLICQNISENNKFHGYYKSLNEVNVSINDYVGLKKPYEIKFKGTEHKYTDEDESIRYDNAPINNIKLFTITDHELGDMAWGWYAYTPTGTQIKEVDPYTRKPVLTRGIRLRCHNIQIGDENFLNKYFKQARSHVYFNGEIFIINQNIIPTANRSDIAPNSVAKKFQEKLETFFRTDLEKLYQEANKANKQLENIRDLDGKINLINENPELTEETKNKRLEELQEKKQKAQETLEKIIAKSKDENVKDSMRTLASDFEREYGKYQNTTSNIQNSLKESDSPGNQDSQHISISNVPKNIKTVDEEIEELRTKYSEPEISLLKQIFQIMDTKCPKKYNKVVLSIKETILNDLRK